VMRAGSLPAPLPRVRGATVELRQQLSHPLRPRAKILRARIESAFEDFHRAGY